MDSHYVCPGGCGGTSDHMKECEADSCQMKGEMMKECHCTDGKHTEVVASAEA